jgi:hypothetical protein
MNDNYIKADGNIYLNHKFIRWIKQVDECYNVCTKSDGCSTDNTHKICKINNPTSYIKINELINKFVK